MTGGRVLHKEWKNDRWPKWTKRARWYQGRADIRLWFEDQQQAVNLYFTNESTAQQAWDRFKSPDVSTSLIAREYADARPE